MVFLATILAISWGFLV